MVRQISKMLILFLIGYVNVYGEETREIPETHAVVSTRIVVRRDKKVMQVYAGDSLVRTYKVAVGKKKTPTPVGEFKIVNKVSNPAWYPKGKDPVEPGAENPVGSRWMGLDIKGYGIHGTNAPDSIGKSASHGCIRMKKKDVEELFQMVSVGTSVQIMDGTAKEDNVPAVQIASANN